MKFTLGNIMIEIIIQIVNFIAAISVIITAYFAIRAAQSAERTLKASIVESIRQNYSKPEIHEAMSELRQFKRENGDDRITLSEIYLELETKKDEKFFRVNKNRRLVSHHFQRICKLNETDIIDDVLMKSLAEEFEAEFFLEVIEPLEGHKGNPNYKRECFDKYRALFPELKAKYPAMG